MWFTGRRRCEGCGGRFVPCDRDQRHCTTGCWFDSWRRQVGLQGVPAWRGRNVRPTPAQQTALHADPGLSEVGGAPRRSPAVEVAP